MKAMTNECVGRKMYAWVVTIIERTASDVLIALLIVIYSLIRILKRILIR